MCGVYEVIKVIMSIAWWPKFYLSYKFMQQWFIKAKKKKNIYDIVMSDRKQPKNMMKASVDNSKILTMTVTMCRNKK